MSVPDIEKVSLTPQHLIFEYVSDESLLGMIAPTVKVRGLKVIRTSHIQVMRYVYTIVAVEDVYFKGRKLPGMPGLREWITEWIQPGQQIVSVPTGKKSVLLRYTGKKNIFQASAVEKIDKSVAMRFIGIYGEDPAPGRVLYGNPSVPFIKKGEEPLMAAAYYNSDTKRLEILHQFDRRTLLENFLRRFAQQESQAATG